MIEITGKKHASSDQGADIQKLVYGISHDMSAPLRAVVQLSQMLKIRLGDKLDEKENYWLQLIEDSGCHAQKMIEALLVYSRLSTHRQPDTKFSLQQTLEQALTGLNSQIKEKSANIQITGDWPEFTGCEEQWLQLFTCLLQNSLLYQPNDADHTPQIIICCQINAEQLRISIEDNGIGVKENLWPVLTTPFKRMQSEKDYPGIGMGLTYSERIAKLHGGSLSIGPSSLGGIAVIYLTPA